MVAQFVLASTPDKSTQTDIMTKRKMCLLGAIIAGFAMVSQVQGAVQNAAWLQGSFLDNGGNELAATAAAPLTISWTSVSSIDTGIFEHSFITPTKLTVKADGDYFVAFNGPHVLSGTPQRATSIFQVFVNGAGVGGAGSRSGGRRGLGLLGHGNSSYGSLGLPAPPLLEGA